MDLVSIETQEENNMIFRLIQQSKRLSKQNSEKNLTSIEARVCFEYVFVFFNELHSCEKRCHVLLNA